MDMDMDMDMEETPAESAHASELFLAKYADSDDMKERTTVIARNLLWRCTQLPPLERAVVLARTLYHLIPTELRSQFSKSQLGFDDFREPLQVPLPEVDVAIITILEVERRAVVRALGRDPDDAADVTRDGRQYWFCDTLTRYGEQLRLVVTIVGIERNVPCAIATTQVLNHFNVEFFLLAGIAAGPKSKVKLGDVMYAERIYDYEHIRLERKKIFGLPIFGSKRLPRPDFVSIDQTIQTDLGMYDRKEFIGRLQQLLKNTDQALLPPNVPPEPTLRDGTAAAGEKLFADGSLTKMLMTADQRLRAADQEDIGFVRAVETYGRRWCVFRGICDYGDPNKGGAWHTYASLAAASAAVGFLKSAWRGPARLRG